MAVDNRQKEINALIAKTQWANLEPEPLAGDASFRRYLRLCPISDSLSLPSAIIMDAPPDKEDVKPFIALALRLRALGYSAPEVYAHNISKGLLLLEDMGDDLYSSIVKKYPHREHELYGAAVDLLVDLHERGVRNPLPISARRKHAVDTYNMDVLMQEVMLLPTWHMRGLYGPDDARDDAFKAVMQKALSNLDDVSPVLVLRDYHAENLMWLPTRMNHERVGLLDFQDALLGHPAYDLVSFLQDARRDVAPKLEEAMLVRYISKRKAADPSFDENQFRNSYALLGAQRNAKILGIFTRLFLRDKKPLYLSYIPRVWKLLERNLWVSDLKPLKAWIKRYTETKTRRKAPDIGQFHEVGDGD